MPENYDRERTPREWHAPIGRPFDPRDRRYLATPAGTPVEVLLDRSEDGGHVVVQVRDHGEGIDEVSARRVFERFYRADKGRSREKGGSGLGLAIVAAIVAGHEGRVGVAPTPGGGATFVVELPTGSSQEAHTAR